MLHAMGQSERERGTNKNGTERERERGWEGEGGGDRRTGRVRGRENGSTKKRWRSLGSPFNVICNTGWPNDATGRDRTGIRVEACERWRFTVGLLAYTKVHEREYVERWVEEVVIYIHVSWSFGC